MRSAEDFAKAHELVMTALHGHFKPEFLNRVDDIIIFTPLGKEQLVKIIDLRLEDLRRFLAERKISIELTDAAKELLFTEGLRSEFRRAAAEARDPEADSGSARDEDSGRRGSARGPRNCRRRRWQGEIRSKSESTTE